ncbi:MAG: hypothetical protein PHT44_01455 [Candidatus Portnoybacteria bacterium]|nr:hypothetical protein [Candidatus Portnoybacteria bacterium]MDD4982739.1 hypothetical protein [Candidatus Portnoybacteria bacterium]
MDSRAKAILAPLIYYDLLDRPLTALEAFKYLRAETPEISFFNFRRELKNSKELPSFIGQKNGLCFLTGRQEIVNIREKRLKLAQLKWKKLKAAGKYLSLVPFLRLAAITGSLTSYNTKEQSDFDLLIIFKNKRLWLGRILLTGLIGLLGKRRHGNLTQDRICLNCYLTEEDLEITEQAKKHNFHSAQEYGRLTPILEIKKGAHEDFTRANGWLADFLKNYPWPAERSAKKIKPPMLFSWLRQALEWLLGGTMGDRLEKIAGQWQNERINKKRRGERSDRDQVFVSNSCLMFHPQSKSDKLMKEFDKKMRLFN